MAEIRIEGLRKTFGNVLAVNGIDLTVADREFLVLLGPSGCGKTTLMRCIAGLEQADDGRILIGDQDMTNFPPRRRNISMVFQSYAVFPHMTVYENIAFGLRMRNAPKDQIQSQVQAAAELMHIENLLQRYPAQLSGGQRQRVAVARALAVNSNVLLMDEPLSNLDALLRLEMRAELKRLFSSLNTTVVYVTHDQVEALSLGDRIAVMQNGEILQIDTPMVIYDYPATHFIGSFIGNPPMNFLTAHLAGDTALLADSVRLPLPQAVVESLAGQEELWMGIRAENIEALESAADGILPATVLVVEALGSHNLLTVQVGAEQMKVNAHPDSVFQPGQQIWLRLATGKIRWFERTNGRAFMTAAEQVA